MTEANIPAPAAEELPEPQPEVGIKFATWDFTDNPPPPRWIVEGFLEEGEIIVLSGDPGSCKSFLAIDLARCIVSGQSWLNRWVAKGTVLYLDEENPERLPFKRLKALSMANEDRGRLLYATRQGVAVDDPGTAKALRALVEEHKPKLVIVDTAYAASAMESVNDNQEVVRFFRALRLLGCAVLVIGHNRKRQGNAAPSNGDALMGSKQWQGQTDMHYGLTKLEMRSNRDDEGDLHQATEVELHHHKQRDGLSGHRELIAVESVTDAEGVLVQVQIRSLGSLEQRHEAAADVGVLLAALHSAPDKSLPPGELAAALGEDVQAGHRRAQRAFAALAASGAAEQPRKRGPWRITPHTPPAGSEPSL